MIAAVSHDGHNYVCDYGIIDEPCTAFHESYTRRCIHALEDLPRVVLFGKDAILRVNFQPVVYTQLCWPSIVKRNNDIVTMEFDRVGDTTHCNHSPKDPFVPAASYRYKLLPMRWYDGDEFHNEPADNVLLGVWPD